jgi:diguanylate cyclase (GGDEF)-like protein
MPSGSRLARPRRKKKPQQKRVSMKNQTRISNSPASDETDVEIVQEHPEDAPEGWAAVQDQLAASTGLSLLLVDGRQPPALIASNNNSICHAFQSSLEHVALCDPYCGDAHRRAMAAGTMVEYKCHAGLQCFTMPVPIGNQQNLAAIGGRAFVSAADYRSLVDRFRAGELNELLEKEPFDNVIFSDSQKLEQLSGRLDKTARSFGPVQSIKPRIQTLPVRESTKPVSTNVPATIQTQQPDLQLEVDRLRSELEYRTQLAQSLQSFLERISTNDPATTYAAILAHVKELLKAERASLWVLDETTNELILRSGSGFSVDYEKFSRIRIGEGIAGKVVESGEPLVVANLDLAGITPSPAERLYKTKSFISYPIITGGRKIGLLNITDKLNGSAFDDVDLSLLQIIGPQIAVALERSEWQERAFQFQLMSITDPLTGLLNRRYLEERLTEELNRSKRYNYAMSCLMIDIDDFKKYNDRNGHQAGDVALKITAHSLKAALRSADIACRYGGEEFCILLPQTTVMEAGVIAERMRQKVAETEYPHGRSQPHGRVSISIGISTFGRNIDTAESVIAAADRALYHAKSQGKNRIEFYLDNLSGSSTAK